MGRCRSGLQALATVALGISIATLLAVPAAADDSGLFPLLPPPPDPPSTADFQHFTDDNVNQFVEASWNLAYNPPDTALVVDTTIAAISIGYPPAGAALAIGKELLSAVGVFDTSDPVGGVLSQVNGRIDTLYRGMKDLQQKLASLDGRLSKEVDDRKFTELLSRIQQLHDLAIDLHTGPQDARSLRAVAAKIATLADRYLPSNDIDEQMWAWSDTHVTSRLDASGQPLLGPSGREQFNTTPVAPDFKPLPMFESYADTLMLWMAAIELTTKGDQTLVMSWYGPQLLRHARFLSVRPLDWHHSLMEPATLPEALLTRLSCQAAASSMRIVQGKCTYTLRCTDVMARRFNVVMGQGSFPAAADGRDDTCMTPATGDHTPPTIQEQQYLRANPLYGTEALARADSYLDTQAVGERDVERQMAASYGLETMSRLADLMIRLRSTGTVREPEQMHFANRTLVTSSVLYGLRPDGQLVWYSHKVIDDREPQQASPMISDDMSKAKVTLDRASRQSILQRAIVGRAPSVIAQTPAAASQKMSPAVLAAKTPQAAGVPSRYGSNLAQASSNVGVKIALPNLVHSLFGPNLVGTGWTSFKQVIPGGLSSIYGLAADGSLKWYSHDGEVDGSQRWHGPMNVGTGWNSFVKIFGAGDGILYGIGTDGSLRWYQQTWTDNTQRTPKWAGPTVVGSGWQNFKQVFAAGEGVIYGVTQDGQLLWYRHTGYLTGANQWEGPRQVGTGWQNFKTVFSPGRGDVYAVKPTGELVWYKHTGYLDGTPSWQGPAQVGADWGGFVEAFPEMWGTPKASVVN